MMQPIRTRHTNIDLGKPADWDDERDGVCVTLPVHRDEGASVMHSWYQPTEVDIANILAGVPIRLSVFGKGHPPVAIAVTESTDP